MQSSQKLAVDDLLSLERYSRERQEFRARVMAHKRNRQVNVGSNTMWLFEDRLTVQYQVQEMLRTERIFEAEGIAEELAAYNPLIPDGTNWKVTFLIEYPDAHHGFDAPHFGQMTKRPDFANPAWCRLAEADNGNIVNKETKQPLTPNDSCWRKGVSLAYHQSSAKKAYADVTAFLKNVFEQK